MLLIEPPRTQADLHFRLFGFPVRVSPGFWLGAALLGWGASDGGDPTLLLVWISAVFVSIVIHELGHALAFRRTGTAAHIVLYHFGGLAIPDREFSTGFSRSRTDRPTNRLLISFAGPAAQLTVASLLMAGLMVSGHSVPFGGFVADLLALPPGAAVEPVTLRAFVAYFLYVNVYWALFNLLPILPLDGGQIARDLFLLWDRADPVRHSLILSAATAAILAVLAFRAGDSYLGIMLGMLAFSSYSALQSAGGHGRGW